VTLNILTRKTQMEFLEITFFVFDVDIMVVMAALCNRGAIIFLPCSFFLLLLLLLFFSSPNLSGRRLDVCHTSTHGVALVRI